MVSLPFSAFVLPVVGDTLLNFLLLWQLPSPTGSNMADEDLLALLPQMSDSEELLISEDLLEVTEDHRVENEQEEGPETQAEEVAVPAEPQPAAAAAGAAAPAGGMTATAPWPVWILNTTTYLLQHHNKYKRVKARCLKLKQDRDRALRAKAANAGEQMASEGVGRTSVMARLGNGYNSRNHVPAAGNARASSSSQQVETPARSHLRRGAAPAAAAAAAAIGGSREAGDRDSPARGRSRERRRHTRSRSPSRSRGPKRQRASERDRSPSRDGRREEYHRSSGQRQSSGRQANQPQDGGRPGGSGGHYGGDRPRSHDNHSRGRSGAGDSQARHHAPVPAPPKGYKSYNHRR